jgi:hypothetical protein
MNAAISFAATGATTWEPAPGSAAWNRVTPLANAGPWLVDALKAIARLAELGENWDGYGSPPIQQATVESAQRLVSATEMDELPTPSVGPVSGGGIGIVWRVFPRELQIEILPDGSVEFLVATMDPATGKEATQEGRLGLASPDQVRRLVSWLING